MTDKTFTCARCHQTKAPDEKSLGTGYAENDKGEKICYSCCAEVDKEHMREHGRIALYLTGGSGAEQVSNWPGTLKFPAWGFKRSPHNIARWRYDVWFDGPDDHVWHGVTYGDNTQICHCKRTKERTEK